MKRREKEDLPVVQWSFLQLKKNSKKNNPVPCFLQSCSQIGSKFLIYGGCDYNGEALSQLFLFDSTYMQWNSPIDESEFQEDHPGCRYGHSATVVEMHPPRIVIYGGMIGRSRTYEFDSPDCATDDNDTSVSIMQRPFMSWRKKGKKNNVGEDADDSIYFLQLTADKWMWKKPILQGGRANRPVARAEHSASKSSANEVIIFGGWTLSGAPSNELWVFNYVDLEWRRIMDFSGAPAAPRYRHTSEMIGSRLFILGGSDNPEDVADGSSHLDLHEMNLATLTWSHPEIKGINPFPRSGHGSVVIGAKSIAIFGGKRSAEVYLNDTVIIDMSTFSSTAVRTGASNVPTPIANCSFVTAGNICFVFGGTDSRGSCYNDMRYLDLGPYLDPTDISVSEGSRSDYSFKILVIGDASVGKTALLARFAEDTFLPQYASTIGIDFNSRMIRVDSAVCKLEIWDTAGQERFSTITANYYRGAQGALLVFDVGLRQSFEHVQTWYERCKQLGGEDIETVLVGNKSDLDYSQRQVTQDDGVAVAEALGIPYIETSALNGSNVEHAFVTMTAAIKKNVDRRGLTGVRGGNLKPAGDVVLATSDKKRRSGACGCG